MKPGEGSGEVRLVDGVVARLDAKGCVVRLDAPVPGASGDGRDLWCSVAGRVHLKDRTEQKSPVAVGDRVRVRMAENRGAAVAELFPRHSVLSRPAAHKGHVEHVLAANVDQVLIVTAAVDPPFNPALVDRILAVAAWSRLPALLVINKMDLASAEPPEAAVYRGLGFAVHATSAVEGAGLVALRAALRDRTSVVTGHSGVGKSSLLNALAPGLDLGVGEINAVSRRGTHTTTGARRHELPGGGAVIDTAGVREFGLLRIPARDLTWLFPDLARAARGCRFPDCSHTHEPGCAIQTAADQGKVHPDRVASYRTLLNELEEEPKEWE